MGERSDIGRPVPSRWRGLAALAATFILMGSVLPGCDGGSATPSSGAVTGSPGATAGVATPGNETATGPTAEPSLAGGGADWAGVELAMAVPEATLRAVRTDTGGVFGDTAFVLSSTGSTPAATLAARMASVPVVRFAVAAGPDSASVTLRPERTLVPGQTYRFDLHGSNGTRTASWAFQVRGPVNVQSTIPGDTATSVPTTTGIEVTFDQDGVAAMGRFFTISPATAGRFERNGRTQVFVPSGLKERTVYTVTVRKGLPVTGTDLKLERDVRFRFETVGPAGVQPAKVRIGRDILQASPTERPVVGLDVIVPDVDGASAPRPTSVAVRVYRYPSTDAAIGQLRLLMDRPAFAEWSEPTVSTRGLPVVLTFKGRIRVLGDVSLITFPSRLPAGWYLVDLGASIHSQAILQVTRVAAWVAVLSDRTVVWANDVVTGRPVSGAGVRLHGGSTLGRTGPSGLLSARTPAALVPPEAVAEDKSGAHAQTPSSAPPILDVRAPGGASVSVPFDVADRGGGYRGEWAGYEPATTPGWWSFLATDRDLYRSTDKIDVWGLLRKRIGGSVPSSVELRLVTQDNDQIADPPVLARASVRPDANGAFSGTLRMDGRPVGVYVVQTVVGGTVVSRVELQVGVIRKPLYELGVDLDHLAVIAAPTAGATPGDGLVTATVTARFFDGRPVPTIPLRATDQGDSSGRRFDAGPTDADGRALVPWHPALGSWASDEHDVCLSVTPARPEEGEIETSACALVFPSAVTLRADGTLVGRRLTVSGDLHLVDLASVERGLAAGLAADSGLRIDGAPVVGASVTAEVTELVPHRTLTGYVYDPISKQVSPAYDYTTTRRHVRTLTLRTAATGRLRAVLTVPSGTHDYEVALRAVDARGRTEAHTVFAGQAVAETAVPFPQFESTVRGRDLDAGYAVGDTIRLTMTDGVKAQPTGGANRYLYIVARQGLRSARISPSSRFVREFSTGDVPGVFIIGVRFTGRTYAPKADTWASFDPAGREITVRLTADKRRYEPRETATIRVRTTDARGRPIAASVILRAVDQKLFAMGAASTIDPLSTLYEREPSGILRLTATHQSPGSGTEGEGGSTGGGGGDGVRREFVDTLAFQQVRTDGQGRATVTLRLSDDLTSWHLSATALSGTPRAGEGQLLIPVGLPFFAEATIADTYLAADRPTIRLRAYGDALASGDRVSFTVSGPTLGLAATRVDGRAFVDVNVPLPRLSVGRHVLRIEATTTRLGPEGRPLADRLERAVNVVSTRFSTRVTDTATVTTGGRLPGSGSATTYTFVDAGRASDLPLLENLASDGGTRVDEAIAQAIAHDLLIRMFGRDPATLPPVALDPSAVAIGTRENDDGQTVAAGVPLLPYAGPDPMLAARIAIVAPDRLDPSALRDVLITIDGLPTTSRELHLAVTAGLASLGVARLTELRAAARLSDLSVRERLYVALGAEAAGDDETARTIEQALLRTYGERLGEWIRIRSGPDPDEIVDLTSLGALVAAGLGDPLAFDLLGYVEANPARAQLHVLDEAGVLDRVLPRLPGAAASFAYTLDGRRRIVTLPIGGSFTLDLTAAQRDAIRLEALTGAMAVSASWDAPVDVGSLKIDRDLGLTRTVTPSGTIPVASIVTVDLVATFKGTAVLGCYDVVETVPSGLAPIGSTGGWVGEDDTVFPYTIVGQQVRFCADHPTDGARAVRLRYLARVITPGTYAWEPTVMRLAEQPGGVAVIPAGRVTIATQ